MPRKTVGSRATTVKTRLGKTTKGKGGKAKPTTKTKISRKGIKVTRKF